MEIDRYLKIQKRLEDHCATFSDKPWNEWPTLAMLAKRYKVRQEDIQDMVEDSEKLDLVVGFRCHNGWGEFDSRGRYQVEYVPD